MSRPVIVLFIVIVIFVIVLPTLIVQFIPREEPQETKQVDLKVTNKQKAPTVLIKVYRTATKRVESIPLEEYIRGVVASEMPANFEIEALKAQALAARTYIIRRLIEKDFSDTPQGAMVTDTIKHQVYHDEEELRRKWGIHSFKFFYVHKSIFKYSFGNDT